MKNNNKEAFDYISYAKCVFEYEHPNLVKRLNELPKESIYILNSALQRIELYIRLAENKKADKKRIALETIDRLISNDEIFKVLQSFPAHMKMELKIQTPGTPKLRARKIEVDKEYNALLLRKRILLKSKKLQKMFNISKDNLVSLYKEQLFGEEQTVPMDKEKLDFLKNIQISRFSHTDTPKTESRKYDNSFREDVFAENSYENFFIIPLSLDIVRNEFSENQITNMKIPQNSIMTYIDIVPATTSPSGSWIYPDTASFQKERKHNSLNVQSQKKVKLDSTFNHL